MSFPEIGLVDGPENLNFEKKNWMIFPGFVNKG